MKTTCLPVLFLLCGICYSEAQTLKKLEKKVERKVNQRIERKTDRAIDKGLNKVEGALDESLEGSSQKQDTRPGKQSETTREAKNTGKTATPAPSPEISSDTIPEQAAFSVQSKFDFVPGEKIIAFEDFSQDAPGDFPAKWNTNSSGEIVTLSGSDGHWLALTTKGAVTPDFISDIPENATVEFDLVVTPSFSFYNQPLFIAIAELNDKNDFTAWQRFGKPKKLSGVIVQLHPRDSGNRNTGRTKIEVFDNGTKTIDNSNTGLTSFNPGRNKVHVALWRQNQRLRVYVDETKIWDLPRAFLPGKKYNSLVFSRDGAKDGELFYITNIRLAAGAPDTRHKLINEGSFSTSGIYFATGSALIKPESHGAIKEIAGVLKENPSVNVEIIGHTDNTGSAASNQTLSGQRAASVKDYLHQTFGIENSRMTTSGKGQTQPVADNTSPEGKAQNRRVEFVKR